MRRVRFLAHVVFDLVIFASVCLTEWAFHRFLKPYKRGFFCDDDSLRYPFRDNTVGLMGLISIVLAVPGTVILTVELFKNTIKSTSITTTTTTAVTGATGATLMSAHDKRKIGNGSPSAIAAVAAAAGAGGAAASGTASHFHKGCQIGQRLMHCYTQIGYYLFGLALTLVTTSITKYSVGRLRPFFFAMCQPQMPDGTTCSDAINNDRYIEDYECSMQNATATTITTLTTTTMFPIDELRQSFPSGHTSISFYAMIYLSIYIQATLSTKASKLFKHLLQFLFIMLSWYVGLTRISDYWHHWSDVLAGAVMGTLIAFAVALYISRLFQRRSPSFSSTYQRFNNNNNNGHNGNNVATLANGGPMGKPLPAKPAISPSSASSKSANNASPILPAYTFGTLPYLTHPQAAAAAVAAAAAAQQHAAHYAAAAQTYHNYGYVP